jgi:hypothetical protein
MLSSAGLPTEGRSIDDKKETLLRELTSQSVAVATAASEAITVAGALTSAESIADESNEDDDREEQGDFSALSINSQQHKRHHAYMDALPTDTIELSQSTLKWLDKADGKYRKLFCRRLEQLASGERSYALSKRLKHCQHPIYETKLDAGQRVLWTRLRRMEDDVSGDNRGSSNSILVCM